MWSVKTVQMWCWLFAGSTFGERTLQPLHLGLYCLRPVLTSVMSWQDWQDTCRVTRCDTMWHVSHEISRNVSWNIMRYCWKTKYHVMKYCSKTSKFAKCAKCFTVNSSWQCSCHSSCLGTLQQRALFSPGSVWIAMMENGVFEVEKMGKNVFFVCFPFAFCGLKL